MDRLLRFGIIGCGRIAKKHAKVLSELEGVRLVAVADVVEERARAYAKEFNTDWYIDYQEMLKRDDIDVVNICTPSGLHPEMGITAAKAGKHVVSEKPMALSLEEADTLIETCEKEGVKLFVVKQNRLNPPIVKLHEALEKGRFGKLCLANITVRWNRPQEYYDSAQWRGTWKFDGGVLMNQASHYVDLLQWMLGPAESVLAMTATQTHRIETEDTAVALVKFKNGALGVIEATTCAYPRNLEGSITILGENGSVKVGGIAVNRMELWEFKDFETEDELVAKHSTTPPDVYGFGHYAYLKNVVEAIKHNKEAATDGREGRKSIELILAIYESARRGREVKLPLKASEGE